jgi:cytochrome c-type biogenesis protein
VGPFLAAVLTVASTHGGAVNGGLLLAAYALGLGLPFVIAALALAGTPSLARRLNRISGPVSAVGGSLLLVLGITLVLGRYDVVSGWLSHIVPSTA